jgi:hypothetical protein
VEPSRNDVIRNITNSNALFQQKDMREFPEVMENTVVEEHSLLDKCGAEGEGQPSRAYRQGGEVWTLALRHSVTAKEYLPSI